MLLLCGNSGSFLAGAFSSLSLSAFSNGWLLLVDKKHTGLVYNSRENSFPDCRCIHSVGVGLGIVHLSFMMFMSCVGWVWILDLSEAFVSQAQRK